eukprot:15468508-Alexandrium_andersonii.AAC.1
MVGNDVVAIAVHNVTLGGPGAQRALRDIVAALRRAEDLETPGGMIMAHGPQEFRSAVLVPARAATLPWVVARCGRLIDQAP